MPSSPSVALANSSILTPVALRQRGSLSIKCTVNSKLGTAVIVSTSGSHYKCVFANYAHSTATGTGKNGMARLDLMQIMGETKRQHVAHARLSSQDKASLDGHWNHPAAVDCSLHLATALNPAEPAGKGLLFRIVPPVSSKRPMWSMQIIHTR